jgi:hypothetical protein
MSAWCPEKQVAYNVSLHEMGAMSEEARYLVSGFLSGDQPGPPSDPDGGMDELDRQAWLSATARFRQSGEWYGRWGTCEICGCVLLPDSGETRCHDHREPPRPEGG